MADDNVDLNAVRKLLGLSGSNDLMDMQGQAAAKAAGIGTIAHPENDSTVQVTPQVAELSEGTKRAMEAVAKMQAEEAAAKEPKIRETGFGEMLKGAGELTVKQFSRAADEFLAALKDAQSIKLEKGKK